MSAPGQPDLGAMVLQQQQQTLLLLTRKSGMPESGPEAKAFADAALAIAQAIVVLDPDRLQGGDTAEARKASVPKVPTRDTDRDGKTGEK